MKDFGIYESEEAFAKKYYASTGCLECVPEIIVSTIDWWKVWVSMRAEGFRSECATPYAERLQRGTLNSDTRVRIYTND